MAIWSTTWFAITFQLGAVAAEVSVAWRFLLAGLLVAAWCVARKLPLRFSAADHLTLAALGLTMYSAGYICVYHAEEHFASGLVAVGFSAAPLLASSTGASCGRRCSSNSERGWPSARTAPFS